MNIILEGDFMYNSIMQHKQQILHITQLPRNASINNAITNIRHFIELKSINMLDLIAQ
jgi:hypothetical protein